MDTSLLDLNEWQAARYGLDARILHAPDASRALGMRDEVERLLDLLAPTLRRLGDGRAVEIIERVLEDGNTADRIRRVHRRTEDMVAVVDWLRAETHAGLYRNPRRGSEDHRDGQP
jgi:glutamate---cysteine ligase / carboxylate-amine ligase